MATKLGINVTFEKLHRPLTKEELEQLTANLLAAKCARDPIVAWQGVIADGHNRYRICNEHKLPYTVVELDGYETEADVCLWIYRHQAGRRNSTPEELKYIRGKLYEAAKGTHGGDHKSEKSKGQNVILIEVAKETGVSTRTLNRDEKYADALDKLPDALSDGIRQGTVKATEKAVMKVAAMPAGEQQAVARKVRVGQADSLDEAAGLKPKKSDRVPALDALAERRMGKEEFDPAKIETPASEVKDGLGNPVPADLARIFRLAPEFDEQNRALSGVKSWLAKQGKGLAERTVSVIVNSATADIKNVFEAIKFAQPHCVCVYCEAKAPKREKCNACKGEGWITEDVYKAAPAAMRGKK